MTRCSTAWPAILHDLMREADVSERELASLTGLSRSTLRRFLRAETSMRVDDLELCLAMFGVELDAHPIPIEEA
ncbi:helix-turn-helix domain-containing protein [Pinisolibacter sp.]|uniref:helix-turn-helix domain-containing protein n=1 Tax=Pinisolibacter sp. TaxID=2172024 RepID=UPI002FDEB225